MPSHRTHALSLALLLGVVACSGTERMKKDLASHGTIDSEWEVRDEAGKKTYTYVLLRASSAMHEVYEITATDGQANVTRELAGGIDGTGCYLTAYGVTTQWITTKGPEIMEGARPGTERTRTACLEYKDTKAWTFVPQKDKKAAEPPPPPPPPPAAGPDAGTSDGGTPVPPPTPAKKPDPGSVEGVPL